MIGLPTAENRRWFQFRLSTWLVLIAIIAWAMAQRPSADYGYHGGPNSATTHGASISFLLDQPTRAVLKGQGWSPDADDFTLTVTVLTNTTMHWLWVTVGPKRLLLPALALVVFVAWKVSWQFIHRPTRVAARPTPTYT